MSLSVRLNLIVSFLLIVIFIAVFFNVLYTTADRLRTEIVNNFAIASQMVETKSKLMHSVPIEIIQPYPYVEVPFSRALHLFKLEHFYDVRYIKVELFDNHHQLKASNRDGATQHNLHIPQFIKNILLASFFNEMDSSMKPLMVGEHPMGQVIISIDNETELRDLWYETLSTMAPLMGLFMLISMVMTLIIAYIIKPVADFVREVNRERGDGNDEVLRLSHMSHLLRLPSYLKGIHHDIKDSTQRVEELNTRILDLQEEERRRISAELHDELGQHLTAIGFEAELIRTAKNIDDTQQSAEAIDEIGRTMKDIVRSMLERLRPPDLDMLGLKGAITEMIANWQLRHPSTLVELDYQAGFPILDESKQLNVYRIVQEALTNISRHAGVSADKVNVTLSADDELLTISIEDNGQGCDLAKQVKGFGLRGMRERVDGLAGQLTLISSPGDGMKIIVELPK